MKPFRAASVPPSVFARLEGAYLDELGRPTNRGHAVFVRRRIISGDGQILDAHVYRVPGRPT